jgi:hypothetical protein
MSRTDEHPWVYLSRRYNDAEIKVDERGCYHLPYDFCGRPDEVTRKDVGLPRLHDEKEPEEPRPATYSQTTMVDVEEQESFADRSF